MRYFYKDFQLLFTRSNTYTKKLKNEILSKKTVLKTLQLGTDTKKFNPSHKKKHNSHAIKQFLYVGRITKEKNIELILDIFQNYISPKEARLLLAGSGEIFKYYKKYKKENIYFLGEKMGKDLYELYASSDCFLFPSITDTLGQVVLEALSSGTPVVVSNIGGPSDILSKATCKVGYVVDTEKKDEWIATIKSLIVNSGELDILSYNAREFACTLDIEKSYEDFLNTHRTLKVDTLTF